MHGETVKFHVKVVEKITPFLLNIFYSENPAVYETMWKKKYIVRAGKATDDNILRRTRIACWITKSTTCIHSM